MDDDPKVYDVIVVGAGLSGLIAARTLKRRGITVCVLEANSYLGGRVLTSSSNVDVGAYYLSDGQTEMFQLADEFGLQVVPPEMTGQCLHLPLDQERSHRIESSFPLVDTRVACLVHEAVQESMRDIEMDDVTSGPARLLDVVSFRTFCRQAVHATPLSRSEIALAAKQYADLLCLVLQGVEADKVSALYMVHYFKSCGHENFLSMLPRPDVPEDRDRHGRVGRLAAGMIRLVMSVALEVDPLLLEQAWTTPVEEPEDPSRKKPCPIITEQTVKSIIQHPYGRDNICTVETLAECSYTSRKVIVSVPTSSYKNIKFDPPLPERKQDLRNDATMGYCGTVVLRYDRPWWRVANLSGAFYAERGPITFAQNTSVPSMNRYTITCFMVGERGREWFELCKETRRDAVLDQVRQMYEGHIENIPEPCQVYDDHLLDILAGVTSFMAVMGRGTMAGPTGSPLATQHRNIHFVGAETATEWRGHLEGAVRSGKRGAREVLQALGREVQGD